MLTEAYDYGRDAGFDGCGEHTNPYRPVNGKQFQDWLQGYRDARQELRDNDLAHAPAERKD
jgi:ribosome modulation factor